MHVDASSRGASGSRSQEDDVKLVATPSPSWNHDCRPEKMNHQWRRMPYLQPVHWRDEHEAWSLTDLPEHRSKVASKLNRRPLIRLRAESRGNFFFDLSSSSFQNWSAVPWFCDVMDVIEARHRQYGGSFCFSVMGRRKLRISVITSPRRVLQSDQPLNKWLFLHDVPTPHLLNYFR